MSPYHSLFGVPAPIAPPIVHWQGASGSWYAHSVYPLHSIPSWIAACNYIFTAPRPDGKGCLPISEPAGRSSVTVRCACPTTGRPGARSIQPERTTRSP